MDSGKTVGEKQLQQFVNDLLDDFYKLLTTAVLPIKKLKKSIKVNEVKLLDTSLLYSRVIVLQLTNKALKVDNVVSFELSPVATSMFDDTDDMKSAKSKSSLNKIDKKCHFGQRRSLNLE